MSMVATDIKGMITIKIKPRHDGMTDQYNRIFMVKILLISSLVMSVSWFKDSINCIVPSKIYPLLTFTFISIISMKQPITFPNL